MANRVHVVAIKLDAAERDANGFAHLAATLTRPGVFKYMRSDGSMVRELRHPDDVYTAVSVESAKRIPVIDNHPASALLKPEDVQKNIVGFTGDDVRVVPEGLTGTVTIFHPDMMAKINDGKRDVSMGYSADMLAESGVWNGEEYDMRQTNIIYNHVAIVDRGRVTGSALRMDADDAVLDSLAESWQGTNIDEANKPHTGDINVKDYKFAGIKNKAGEIAARVVRLDDDSQVLALIGECMDMCKALGERVEVLEGEKAAAEAARDESEEEKKELEEKMDGLTKPEAINAQAHERATLLLIAGHTGVEKPEAMSNADVRRAILAKHSPSIKLDGASDGFVEGAFASVSASIAKEMKAAGEFALLAKMTGQRFETPATVTEAKKDATDTKGVSPADAYRRSLEKNGKK